MEAKQKKLMEQVKKDPFNPEVWKEGGKAMGWDSGCRMGCNEKNILCIHYGAWRTEWHKFIDWLADGGTIETFFEKL